jgi:phosphate transport system protein
MRLFSRQPPQKSASVLPTVTVATPDANARPQAEAQPAPEPHHTLRAFGEALSRLAAEATQMGLFVGDMVDQSATIFLEHDVAKAKALIQRDLEADRQKDALLAHTLDILALHQPVASDLRLLLSVEHIARDLERSADHAKNIAKRTLTLTSTIKLDPTLEELIRGLHGAVRAMFADAVTAFATKDAALANDLRRRDLVPDAINDDLFHAVIARLQTHPAEAPIDIQALFVGKSLERIGDHATNIAEAARFVARGEAPSATRER